MGGIRLKSLILRIVLTIFGLILSSFQLLEDSIQEITRDTTYSTANKIILIDSLVEKYQRNKKSLSIDEIKLISKRYSELGATSKKLNFLNSQINRAQKNDLTELYVHTYEYLGDLYFANKKLDSAYYSYRQAYQYLEQLQEAEYKELKGRLLYSIAYVQESAKDYVGAEKSIVKVLADFKETGDPVNLFLAYNLLAITQNGLKDYDKAIEYHEKAKQELVRFSDAQIKEKYALSNLNNIANTNLRAEKYITANAHYELLFAHQNFLNINPELYAKALANRVFTELQLGTKNEGQLINDLNKSMAILDSLDNNYNKALVHHIYAEVLSAHGESEKAIEHALKAKDIASETENNDRLLSVLTFLSEHDNDNSAAHASDYIALNERLIAEERAIQEKFARIQYETAETEQENVMLAKQKKLWAGISLGLLLLGIGILVILSQRADNQRLKFEQQQQAKNQEIYNLMLSQQGKLEEGKKSEQKRISEELHDGILGQMLGIRLLLSGLNEREDESAVEQRAELIEKLQGVEEEIRTISHELSQSAYEKVDNFLLSLQEMLMVYEQSNKVAVKMVHDENIKWNQLPGDDKINIYRIIQEAVQNAVKHANCKNIEVNLDGMDDGLLITITDDGKGFKQDRVKKGIGIKNISSRTRKLNGIFDVKSAVGKGTTVSLQIPFEKKEKVEKENPIILWVNKRKKKLMQS